jgi:GNAT superfamily N-acetyltransferase
MSVRAATIRDIPEMHELRLAVHENRLADPLKVQPADYQRFLTGHGLGWVFEHEGQIVAFAIADIQERSVWALFVLPGFEGRGFGRILHDTMTAALFAIDHRPLWLCTEPHTRAEKFYRAAGWGEAGREPTGEIRFEKMRDV